MVGLNQNFWDSLKRINKVKTLKVSANSSYNLSRFLTELGCHNTLEELDIAYVTYDDIIHLIANCPNLKKLDIWYTSLDIKMTPKLNRIQEINFLAKLDKPIPAEDIINLVKKLPTLEALTIRSISVIGRENIHKFNTEMYDKLVDIVSNRTCNRRLVMSILTGNMKPAFESPKFVELCSIYVKKLIR